MSKQPTSMLSARDVAAMKYGYAYFSLVDSFRKRHEYPFPCKGMARDLLAQARDARERVFRNCFDCEHCFVQSMYCCKPGEEPRELMGQYDKACTCSHYQERREA